MKIRKSACYVGAAACAALVSAVVGLYGCGKSSSTATPPTEDSSASGAAASVVGGALSGSGSGGTQSYLHRGTNTFYASLRRTLDFLPEARAAVACPTFRTIDVGCAVSASTMWLNYSSCSFGSSPAVWNGTQALIMSAGTAACGAFPNPGANGTLVRQMVAAMSSATPASTTVTSSFGTSITIDNATANLGNFNGDPISTATYANNGYGVKVTFNSSGARSAVAVAEHTKGAIGGTTIFDHSVNGSLTISETAGSTSRTITGSVTVYHNLVKVIGTSTFNNVTHSDTCCLPIAGSITTAFSAATTAGGGSGVAPTLAGSKLVGKSETLTFTGCGTGTLVDVTGNSTNVTLSRCG